MARKKKTDEELEREAALVDEGEGVAQAAFVLCPPKRGHETAERRATREACERAAAERNLSVARMLDTRPTLHTPEGYRYSSGSVVAATKGALSTSQRREYGCVEVGYTDAERRRFGCVVDDKGKFTGVLADGTKDRRCAQPRRFSGERRVGDRVYADSMCSASFGPPCGTDRFGRAGEPSCPVQLVTVGGQSGLRLCRGQGEPGELMRADGPAAIEALASRACAWWRKHKTWDGFAPGEPKGFGKVARRRRRAA